VNLESSNATNIHPKEKYNTDIFSSIEKAQRELAELRQHIDIIDNQMSDLFLQRMILVEKVGKLKRVSDIPVEHSDREKEILERLTADLSPEQAADMDALFRQIFKISCQHQNR